MEGQFQLQHEQLTPLPDGAVPDYYAITTWEREIFTNARGIRCTRGWGRLGHLGLVCEAEKYTTLSNVPFTNAFLPGEYIQFIPAADEQSRAIIKNIWEQTMKAFNVENNQEAELQHQLLKACPKKFLQKFLL